MSDLSDSPAAPDSPARSPTPSGSSPGATPPPRKRKQSSDRSERSSRSRGSTPAGKADNDDRSIVNDDDDEAGLFGEDSDVEEKPKKRRALDDEELDSGDDADRRDRMEDVDAPEQRELNVVGISLGRHAIPQSTDRELYLLRYSRSVGLQRDKFDRKTFKPPVIGHHNTAPTGGFSAAQTSTSTIRWRRSPDDPRLLQSNSRIIRWSDGSLTLQLAGNAKEQLELPPKILAPPQNNPPKPTPTSLSGPKAGSAGYDARLDSHTYIASIHQETSFVQLTNHVTTSLTVQSNIEENDDALIRLQEQMAAMSKGYAKPDQATGPGVLTVMEDPELAKRKAELAERDRLRAQKRRETQEQRMRERQAGVLGTRSMRAPFGSGLALDELDASPRRPRPRKPRRRGSEYSEDEDEYGGGRGRNREDEYDEDDGFVAGSDEEIEMMDDDDEDDLDRGVKDADDSDAKPGRSPKRSRGDDDGPSGAGPKRGRRQVLDDDDDDE